MVTAQELCDRVAFNDGRITELDSPQALRRAYGRRALRVEVVREGFRETREFALERLGDNQHFLAWIHAGTVESMHTLETTLDDVFVQVTGRKLA